MAGAGKHFKVDKATVEECRQLLQAQDVAGLVKVLQLSLSHALSPTLTLTPIYTPIHTLSLSHTRSQSLSRTHTLTLSRTHTVSHSIARTGQA